MAFDLASAKPIGDSAPDKPKFDLASAKPVASAAAKEEETTPSVGERVRGAVGAVGEPLMQMGSAMFAKPVSDVAGMARLGMEGLRRAGVPGIEERDPLTVKQDVQRALTYEPRTKAGQAVSEYNPLALMGRGFDWMGEKAGQVVAPPRTSGPLQSAIGSGVAEGVKQIPQFLGAKSPKVFQAAKESTENMAKELMSSALKPTIKEGKGGRAGTAVDVMLKEGLNVTPKGLEELTRRIDTLNNGIARVIDNSPAVIDKEAVASRLFPLMEKFQKQVNATSDVAAIEKAWNEFMEHPLLKGKDIPVKTAQEMKTGTYQQLRGKYGELKSADVEAQKTLARGLKEEIAKAVPQVRQLNAEESRLLTALPMVERRVLVSANKNPIGLGWLIHNPTSFFAFMADRSELFKSLVSRMINTGAQAIPTGRSLPLAGMAVTAEAGQPPQIGSRPQQPY